MRHPSTRRGLRVLWVFLVLILVPVAEASLDRVQALVATGQRAQAREMLDSLLAVEAVPIADRDRAILQRATLEEDGAQYESRLRQLVGEDPQGRAGHLHLALGHVAFARGDLDDALAAFDLARESGLVEEGSLWTGLAALALGDGDTARRNLEQAARSGSRSLRQRARLALGDAHRIAGDCDAAILQYRALREESGSGPGWWSTAAWHEAECLIALGQEEDAAVLLEVLGARAPDALEAPLARERLAGLVVGPSPPVKDPETEAAPADTGRAGSREYVLQVGAFSVRGNADGLARALEGRGVEGVFIESGADGLSRVLVGAFADRDAAEAVGDSLGAGFGLGFTVLERETP